MKADLLRELPDYYSDESLFPNQQSDSDLSEREQNSSGQQESWRDTLQSEDWLVRGTLNQSFWEIPVTTSKGEDQRPAWRTPALFQDNPKDEDVDRSLGSQLGGFLAKRDGESKYFKGIEYKSTPFGIPRSVEVTETSELTETVQRMEGIREDLGSLVRPTPQPWPQAGYASGTFQKSFSESYAPNRTTTPFGTSIKSSVSSSLYPSPLSDQSYLYPSSPVAPKSPSLFDSFELETPATPAFAPQKGVSNPLYRPPQRPY